jgi:hypothetical protein
MRQAANSNSPASVMAGSHRLQKPSDGGSH